MKLADYLRLTEDGTEVTVHDATYVMESYFYNDDDTDAWTQAMNELAGLLTITQIYAYSVEVNLSDLIEKNLDKIKEANLFRSYDLDDIMAGMDSILSGNVSEQWMQKFVECLR